MRSRRAFSLATLLAVVGMGSVLLAQTATVRRRRRGCAPGMVFIDVGYCIDRYEGGLREVLGRGRTRPWSPFYAPSDDGHYLAVSHRGIVPQGYISQHQAAAACHAAHKRLCTENEWVTACRGPQPTVWPYGDTYIPRRCNDSGDDPVLRLFAPATDVFHDREMNDPRLNQMPHTVARTGAFVRCTNRYGVHDMVGNLHEWIDAHYGHLGVFRGGFYEDVHQNGDGCNYATRAHSPNYHDYSTGFRCCADPR